MTQQFDEGVKEILMTLLSVGATMYETDYVLDQLKKRPEPIEQQIQAVDKAQTLTRSPAQTQVLKKVEAKLKKVAAVKPVSFKKNTDSLRKVLPKPKAVTKEQYIYNKLIKGGLTHIAAIGILANLKIESYLDPAKHQLGGGPGRGLAQWEKGGRYDTDRVNLVNFAKKRGKDWTDLNTQIDFILHEMSVLKEYRKVKEMLNRAKTIEDATLIFLTKYEKAGKPHTTTRQQAAAELDDTIKRANS